jgi:hypothetical protein
MEIRILRYPGDPDETIKLMTGAEFRRDVRKGQPGYLKVGPLIGPDLEMDEAQTQTIYFDEIVCDLCNAEIKDEDMLAMNRHSAYCMDCYNANWKPWILP